MIALLCNRFQDGYNYFPNMIYLNKMEGKIKLDDGREIIIVTELNHLRGREFEDVLITPNYEGSLILEAKSRIRS